jgi:cardiolipin synthase (CMP-forming)
LGGIRDEDTDDTAGDDGEPTAPPTAPVAGICGHLSLHRPAMGTVTWFRDSFIPWTRGRMFRTGVPLDSPVIVTNRVFTIANALTLIRLLGLPLFVYLAAFRRTWLLAFIVFGVLAVLDTIDGYVARRFNQSTRLGAALDPLTDRLTVLTVCVILVITKVIPVWLVVLVLLRDLLLLALVAVLARLGRPLPVSQIPVTRIGKLANMTLLVGLPFLLLARTSIPGRSTVHIAALVLVCGGAVLYYVGLVQYAKAGITSRAPTTAEQAEQWP